MMYGDGYGMRPMDGSGLYFFLACGVVVALILAGLMVVIAMLLRASMSDGTAVPEESEAQRILRRRYAAGEIDDAEYRNRSALLADHRP